MILKPLIPFATALIVAVILVPIIRRLAVRFNLVDQPDAERKLHSRPIALAGGVGVFISVLAAIGLCLGYQNDWSIELNSELFSTRWMVLLGSAFAILMVGLVDDVFTLRGRQKLLAQCLISMVIVGSGTVLKQIGIFGYDIPLGIFAIPVSVLWLLIAINALNLLDGADGMATTVGIFVSGSLAILSLMNRGPTLDSLASFALCGSLCGFLVYNRPPATIFLGDAGSMMVGLFIGVLSMWCSLKESTLIAAAPAAILVLPLFDSSAAIARRWLTGRSLYTTDRGHMHHVLHEKFGPVGMLLVVAFACALSSSVAIGSMYFGYQWFAPVGALAVLLWLIGTRTFGYSESRLLAGKVRHLTKSFLVRPAVCTSEKQERSLKMQGDGPWQEVWEPMIEFAQKHDLASVKVDANLPWLHESYHATWRSVRLPEKAFQNVVRVPLFAWRGSDDSREHVPIGRLEVVADSSPGSLERLGDFLEHAAELQTQVESVAERLEAIRTLSDAPVPEPFLPEVSSMTEDYDSAEFEITSQR